MTDEIYNPPTAPLMDRVEEATKQEFYVVSRKKFLLLFMLTFGLYQMYWLYRNWKLQKVATGLSVIPFLRAAFFVFFFHSLFRRIDHRLRHHGKKFYWSPDSYATGLVVLTIISNLLDRFVEKFEMPSFMQFAPIAMLPLIAYAYLPAVQAINKCCDDPDGNSNNALTLGNYAWLVTGAILWVAAIWGATLPAEPAG